MAWMLSALRDLLEIWIGRLEIWIGNYLNKNLSALRHFAGKYRLRYKQFLHPKDNFQEFKICENEHKRIVVYNIKLAFIDNFYSLFMTKMLKLNSEMCCI